MDDKRGKVAMDVVPKDHDTCKVCTLLLQSISSTVNIGHYVSDELRNPRQYNLHKAR